MIRDRHINGKTNYWPKTIIRPKSFLKEIKPKSSLDLTNKLSYLLVNKLEKIMDNIYGNKLSYFHLIYGMII
jgi:hypothetical protein